MSDTSLILARPILRLKAARQLQHFMQNLLLMNEEFSIAQFLALWNSLFDD
jgi:hypothetical protein